VLLGSTAHLSAGSVHWQLVLVAWAVSLEIVLLYIKFISPTMAANTDRIDRYLQQY